MKYVACLRVGQNDIKALVNIERERRSDLLPLLDMRGKDDKHLQNFLDSWGEAAFLIDTSRVPADAEDLHNRGILDSSNAFSKKLEFFENILANSAGAIPVISWIDTDPQRDIVQFALSMSRNFQSIAIRVNITPELSDQSEARLFAILDSIPSPEHSFVVLDYCTTRPADLNAGSKFHKLLLRIDRYNPKGICLLSTSFPADKPASNSARTVLCTDPVWQISAKALGVKTKILEGDYGATNPAAPMEYVIGMAVIPFANYYIHPEWWQRRKGGDKEYSSYIEIAKEITTLPGFNRDHCWGTREIQKIANLPATADSGYGNNGHWNGIKSNQHICTTLDRIRDRETADYDDLI